MSSNWVFTGSVNSDTSSCKLWKFLVFVSFCTDMFLRSWDDLRRSLKGGRIYFLAPIYTCKVFSRNGYCNLWLYKKYFFLSSGVGACVSSFEAIHLREVTICLLSFSTRGACWLISMYSQSSTSVYDKCSKLSVILFFLKLCRIVLVKRCIFHVYFCVFITAYLNSYWYTRMWR